RIAQVIAGDKVAGANCQLRTKFGGGRPEIALAKVNEPLEVVRFSEIRVDFEGRVKFSQCACIVLLLSMSLAQKKVDVWIVGVLFQEVAKERCGKLRLAGANQGRAPGEEQPGVTGRRLEERLQHFDSLRKVFIGEVTQPEELAHKRVSWIGLEVALEWRDRLCKKPRAGARGGPIAVKPPKAQLPRPPFF